MKNLRLLFGSALLLALVACGQKQAPSPASADPSSPAAEVPAASQTEGVPASDQPADASDEQAATPAENISETDDGAQENVPETTSSTVQPALKLGGGTSRPATSSFKEGANYSKVVPAQPTTVGPGQVEVVEVFWYGCGHCFALDPAIESWRKQGKPGYVQFVRIPAMWNDTTRMHARLFYTAEALGKLDELHSDIFREINVKGNGLNTVANITAFFRERGVSPDDFQKAFSSFAVENKLQRADFLNRRYRIESVPTIIVNGKYRTDVGMAGGEPQLFKLIGELSASEHGG